MSLDEFKKVMGILSRTLAFLEGEDWKAQYINNELKS